MLKFEKDEDAVFIGKEAEGYFRGLDTVFVVGRPSLSVILEGLHYIWNTRSTLNFGVYLGAGSSINKLPYPKDFTEILKVCWTKQGFERITIESCEIGLASDMYIAFSNAMKSYNNNKFVHFEWIVPLVFDSYRMSNANIQRFKDISKLMRCCNFVGKVHVPGKATVLAQLEEMYLTPDFDNNEAEYANDKLIWKGNINAKETVVRAS